jgi:hypothetical protein
LRHLCPLSVDGLDSARTNCTADGSQERGVAESAGVVDELPPGQVTSFSAGGL